MALTLVSTVGGATSNSYATRAGLVAYLEGRAEGAAFLAAVGTVQDFYLVAATSRLEQETYKGIKTDTVTPQRLKFPRIDIYDEDGTAYADDEIPRVVLEATYELAFYLYSNAGTDVFAPTGLEPFESLDVGSVAMVLRDSIPSSVTTGLPPQVTRLLMGLRTSGGSSKRTVRA